MFGFLMAKTPSRSGGLASPGMKPLRLKERWFLKPGIRLSQREMALSGPSQAENGTRFPLYLLPGVLPGRTGLC